jgi:peroxiredoxin
MPSTARYYAAAAVLLLVSSVAQAEGDAMKGTVLYGDRTISIDLSLPTEADLWATPAQVTEITGYTPKPEGLCRDDVCIPISRKPADGFVQTKDGVELFNLTKLADKLSQPVVTDAKRHVWSFGPLGTQPSGGAAPVAAPDFALPDRQGKTVKLSDFRGKKVLLMSWASWCRCREDLAGWETVYKDLKGKNFELVAVAEDTEGEAACGKYYDQAKATYTTLIDKQHVVSSLYKMVNVPMGVWIDEEQKIVRPAEVAYSRPVAMLSIKVDGGRYVEGLQDWVEKGPKSEFALSTEELRKRAAPADGKLGLAEANFKLAVHLQLAGDEGSADYFKAAQDLAPDNWNYHRQQWAFKGKAADMLWLQKFSALKGKPYYAPLDLPPAKDQEKK